MSERLTPDDLHRFRTAIASQIGLAFDDSKLDFLGEVLSQRLDALKCSANTYIYALEHAAAGEEIATLAGALTVTETYFFRCREQFQALAEIALPSRMDARSSGKSLKLLSAGCASGEEPYSLAIVACETVTDPGWDIEIRAVDINRSALEKARNAIYSTWAMRETPPEIRRKRFRQHGRNFILAPAVREAVRFRMANLASADPELWEPSAYDVIFFRNVMMYFGQPQMEAVAARLADALAPGGYLFLGAAETLRGLSDSFHTRNTHETFYYQRKDGKSASSATGTSVGYFPAATVVPAPPAESWVDVIRASTDRVASLTLHGAAEAVETASERHIPNLTRMFELLRQERFTDALAQLADMKAGQDDNPDLLVVEAALLVQAGEFASAEQTARHLLEIEKANAGAHYVLALTAEQAGRISHAADHDHMAIYFQPSFAMPHLHLGLLARRAGEHAKARREFAQAQTLLHQEDAARILLFGGGFSREALIALCGSIRYEQRATP